MASPYVVRNWFDSNAMQPKNDISEWRKSSVLVLGTRGVGATTDFGDQSTGCLTCGKVIVFLPDRPDRLVSWGVSNSPAVLVEIYNRRLNLA